MDADIVDISSVIEWNIFFEIAVHREIRISEINIRDGIDVAMTFEWNSWTVVFDTHPSPPVTGF